MVQCVILPHLFVFIIFRWSFLSCLCCFLFVFSCLYLVFFFNHISSRLIFSCFSLFLKSYFLLHTLFSFFLWFSIFSFVFSFSLVFFFNFEFFLCFPCLVSSLVFLLISFYRVFYVVFLAAKLQNIIIIRSGHSGALRGPEAAAVSSRELSEVPVSPDDDYHTEPAQD